MKLSQGLVRSMIGCWTRSGLLWFTSKKNVRVIMEFEVPNRHIWRPTFSTDMVQRVWRWERQKRCCSINWHGPMAKKCCYNKILTVSFGGPGGEGGKDEDKRRQENDQTWFFCPKLPFLDIYLKKQHIHFLMHGHSSWSTFGLNLVRGPKALWIYLKKKLDHGLKPSFMVRLHAQGV
jgi:hypothetical protein